VATRSGLAQFWFHADIGDASGNSQWACSALNLYEYRRSEWQLAVATYTNTVDAVGFQSFSTHE